MGASLKMQQQLSKPVHEYSHEEKLLGVKEFENALRGLSTKVDMKQNVEKQECFLPTNSKNDCKGEYIKDLPFDTKVEVEFELFDLDLKEYNLHEDVIDSFEDAYTI